MSSSIPADMMDEVYDRAMARAMELVESLTPRLIRPDGTTFGDEPLDRGERIARFIDYAEEGVLDTLKIVKPKLLERMTRQFVKDILNTPFEEDPVAINALDVAGGY